MNDTIKEMLDDDLYYPISRSVPLIGITQPTHPFFFLVFGSIALMSDAYQSVKDALKNEGT